MWEKKWFGIWLQDGENYQNCPDIEDWIGCEILEKVGMIEAYLQSGNLVAASPISTKCHLCSHEIDTSKVFLTDGVWMWPKDLGHYVLEHNLQLPETFLDHIRQNNFHCPRVNDGFDMMSLDHP